MDKIINERKVKIYKSGFTLIELMVVIIIIMIITLGVAVPYNFYSNVAKVKISKEVVSQSISIARNSSAGLINSGTQKNQNVALMMKRGENKISMYSFPYDYKGAIEVNTYATLINTISLEDGVNITSIKDKNGTSYDTATLYFLSPNGEMTTYFSPTSTGSLKEITVGLKVAKEGLLAKSIELK